MDCNIFFSNIFFTALCDGLVYVCLLRSLLQIEINHKIKINLAQAGFEPAQRSWSGPYSNFLSDHDLIPHLNKLSWFLFAKYIVRRSIQCRLYSFKYPAHFQDHHITEPLWLSCQLSPERKTLQLSGSLSLEYSIFMKCPFFGSWLLIFWL